jgi:hypothetical protein
MEIPVTLQQNSPNYVDKLRRLTYGWCHEPTSEVTYLQSADYFLDDEQVCAGYYWIKKEITQTQDVDVVS